MADEPMVLARIIIDLVIDENGGMRTDTRAEGTLQYVTGMGMLAIAQNDLITLVEKG